MQGFFTNSPAPPCVAEIEIGNETISSSIFCPWE